MDLSFYSSEKLEATKKAIELAIQTEANKDDSDQDYLVSLTYMLGEVKCAIDDKEIEERQLNFRRPSSDLLKEFKTLTF